MLNLKTDPSGGATPSHTQFTQTRWTQVLAARDRHSPATQDALAALCQAYWYPLYAFIRRRVYSPHDAQDLTQDFFSHLLRSGALEEARRDKGKFR